MHVMWPNIWQQNYWYSFETKVVIVLRQTVQLRQCYELSFTAVICWLGNRMLQSSSKILFRETQSNVEQLQ